MTLLLTEEQRDLSAAVTSLIGRHVDSQRVRLVQDRGEGFDDKTWAALVEFGIPALLVPEEHGGLGLGLTEATVVAEAAGRVLAPVPLHTALLSAAALSAVGDQHLVREILPELAAGQSLVALAFTEEPDSWIPDRPSAVFSGGSLNGEKSFVRDGQFADRLLVLASSAEGQVLVLVDGDEEGVEVEPLSVLDRGVYGARIRFASVAGRRLDVDDIGAFLEKVDSVASVLIAAAQYGAYSRSLEITTKYAKDRYQFGRPIGAFQGVKHPLAEWATEAELAYSLLRHATALGDSDAAGFRRAALAVQVKMQSISYSGATWMARLHGGIGYTWEHDTHLYLKNAKTTQLLLGTPGGRKDRLASALGI